MYMNPPPYTSELKYGSWRMFLLCFVSAVGGSFFSALFESGCRIVVGASGGVFGVFGLFIADMVVNFESIPYPAIRAACVVAFLIFFLVSVATESTGVSHLSHFGGLVSGLFPSFLFLPNFVKEDWEVYLPHCGIAVLFVVFFIFPIIIYEHILPGIACDV